MIKYAGQPKKSISHLNGHDAAKAILAEGGYITLLTLGNNAMQKELLLSKT